MNSLSQSPDANLIDNVCGLIKYKLSQKKNDLNKLRQIHRICRSEFKKYTVNCRKHITEMHYHEILRIYNNSDQQRQSYCFLRARDHRSPYRRERTITSDEREWSKSAENSTPSFLKATLNVSTAEGKGIIARVSTTAKVSKRTQKTSLPKELKTRIQR